MPAHTEVEIVVDDFRTALRAVPKTFRPVVSQLFDALVVTTALAAAPLDPITVDDARIAVPVAVLTRRDKRPVAHMQLVTRRRRRRRKHGPQ